MAIPSIFAGDEQTERLAGYFEELYDYLLAEGVPEDCLPSPWHVLRHVTRAIDQELLREWLDAYVAVEGEESDEDEESDGEETGHPEQPVTAAPRRKRPGASYLRALGPEAPEDAPDEKTS